MKTIRQVIIICSALCLCAGSLYSQDRWFGRDSITNLDLWDVHFFGKDNIIAVGGYSANLTKGEILITDDGGENWYKPDIPDVPFLNVAFYVNDTLGFVAGEQGTILKTTNGGESWTQLTSGTTASLLSVYFFNDTVGFAVGGNYTSFESGILIRTDDGGTSWKEVDLPKASSVFWGISFADSLHGWVVGQDTAIVHTADGGLTWFRQDYDAVTSSSKDLFNVYALDSNRVWVTGSGGTIMCTTDGGDNWIHQSSGHGGGIFDVYFIDSLNGYVVGGFCKGCINGSPPWDAYLLNTNDGGETWSVVVDSTSDVNPLGFYGFDASHDSAMAVGYDGNILCTWPLQDVQQWYLKESHLYGDMFGVWYTDDSTGYVVGQFPSNCILKTTDSGQHWDPLSYPSINGYFSGLGFGDPMTGWVTGEGGIILKTEDAGNSWDLQNSGTSQNLDAFYCLNNDLAWASGAYGTILKTTGGGDTWQSEESGISSHISKLFFMNADTGFAVGGSSIGFLPTDTFGGYVLRTLNGGNEWSVVKFDTTTIGFYGVYFPNTTQGFVTGAGGKILRTNDCGETWMDISNDTLPELWDVYFINSDTGYIAGGNWLANNKGIILRTINGGLSWKAQKIPTDVALNKIFITGSKVGTAVGNDGIILSTLIPGPVPEDLNSFVPDRASCRIYPNPTTGELSIEFEKQQTTGTTIELIDISGKVVYSGIINPNETQHQINLSSFEEGLYLIRISNTEYTITKKVIKVE